MKKILIGILVIAGCWTASVFGAEADFETAFSEANGHYAEGDYEKAAALYEELLASGLSSGPLYYNLGNTYFKLNRIGKSILNYERARHLLPQDEDLLANLSFVKTFVEQEQPKEERRWYEWLWVSIRDYLSAEGWVLFLLLTYHLFFGSLFLALFAERLRRGFLSFGWFLLVLTGAAVMFGSAKITLTAKTSEAVVVSRVADVRYSPMPEGIVAFQLREGIQTEILRRDGEWCYLRLTRDKSGWVRCEAVEEI